MSDLKKITVMGLQEAKDFQGELRKEGVELVLNHDDSTCTRGCAVTVELLGKESDFEKIQEVYSRSFNKMLEGMDFDPEIISSVYDNSQASATCPACGHNFATTNSECPDCGLVLG